MGMSTSETTLRDTFKKIQKISKQCDRHPAELEKIRKKLKPHEKTLLAILDKGNAFALLQSLLSSVGALYRTTTGDLLFFREADHKLYDLEEKSFERYLVNLTDSVSAVCNEWLPRLQAWVRFDAPEVATHFLAYNDGSDLDTLAVNSFDGYMMRRKRGGRWKRVPNGTDGILFLTPPRSSLHHGSPTWLTEGPGVTSLGCARSPISRTMARCPLPISDSYSVCGSFICLCRP